ncbi:MFS transporter [Candidatus Formimonas warabiya]|uniref:MFS transporter n=1 Tax=Formimonas warabiya TaxID=1761012 RepID=A0A3G1KWE6_FORW1|nr:MFS transporter [Candidatus Formimonas warabiya]ATW26818.1 MFS transporter [Candidatus Formimonas warabiya]
MINLGSSFAALRHRNFRLFWIGQCISLVGTWMQNIGQAWLVLQLTKSAFKLSLVSATQFLPMMLFALFAGTLVDKFPRRRILLITQASLMVLAVTLASLTYFQVVQYWHVLVLALLLGIVNTLDMPTRQSFFVELVGKEDLMNAIALNSTIFNLARMIGPAVAGFLISLVGIAMCFYLNALSFLAVLAGIWMIDTPDRVAAREGTGSIRDIFSDIGEGLRYISQNAIILHPLLLLALISTFVLNFNVLIPVFAKQDLGQNAAGYGFLMTCMGIGSFIGALVLAVRSKTGPRISTLVGGAAGTSLFLLLLGLQHNYILACATLLVMGFCSITFTAMVNSTIQMNSADNMRGRVMSVFSLVFGGVAPIGSLYAGNIMEFLGAQGCMKISGVIGILAAAYTLSALWGKHRHRGISAGQP